MRRHLGCDRVVEEGWGGGSDARQPDAAGMEAEKFGGAVGGWFARGARAPHRDETAMNGAPGGPNVNNLLTLPWKGLSLSA